MANTMKNRVIVFGRSTLRLTMGEGEVTAIPPYYRYNLYNTHSDSICS